MRRRPSLEAIGLMAGAVAECGEAEPAPPTADTRVPAVRTAITAAARADAGGADERRGRPAAVSGQANILGAGRAQLPQPGGGGGGKLPPGWRLRHAAHRVLTVRRVAGLVSPIVGDIDYNGSAGDRLGPTYRTSYRGISGIVHRRNGMFLVGAFLSDAPPSDPAPPRLDFTRRDRHGLLAPRLAQTFMVGDAKCRASHVPPRATRLYLRFADDYLYQGAPGWYGNNRGKLTVTVSANDRASG
jgi:hypothetical protein